MNELMMDRLTTNPLRLCAARVLLRLAYTSTSASCALLPEDHPTRIFMSSRSKLSRDTALESLSGPRDNFVLAGAVALLIGLLDGSYELLTLTPWC